MKERLENRLKALEEELEKGQGQLQQLDDQRDTLEKTLLRISGAIQVLKEELEYDKSGNGQQANITEEETKVM